MTARTFASRRNRSKRARADRAARMSARACYPACRVATTSATVASTRATVAPAKTLVVTSGNRSLPLCSYPNYPKYVGGSVEFASSYVSAAP